MQLSRRSVVLGGLVGSIAVAVPVSLAATGSGGYPADKAVAAGSTRAVLAENQTETLLSATFRTSKTTDLIMSVSLECSILTSLVTNNETPTSTAGAGLRAWLEIDGVPVAVEDLSAPPQDPADTAEGDPATDAVTFCDREYARSVVDDENPADGVDEEDDYIQTKSSHSFTWVRMNAGSGVHTVELVGTLRDSQTGGGDSEAIIGNRTLIIEPTKMANNAVIAESGSSQSGNG